jgi:2-keto-3-deoxy-L-arabinonate dehydratase
MANTEFRGVYPILYAFFNRDGSLDREAMRAQVEGCIAGGAHGIAILGLATEVNKLNVLERRTLMEWAAQDIGRRVPYAVTVAEPSINGQIEFVTAAAQAGANWVILQPPPVLGVAEAEYARFFGAVADASPVPVAIQNAPGLIATSLSNATLRELNRRHPNLSLLKAEGPATYVQSLIEETEGCFDVFNGYNGLQWPNSLRAGCAGLIPSPDTADVHAKIYGLMKTGNNEDEAQAERLHRDLLPLIVFLMTTVEHLVAYGKRLAARRLGIREVYARAPAIEPTAFGLACMARYSSHLGPLL